MDLRRVRLELDITIYELALASGVHRDTIHRIESYSHTPTAATVDRLAAGLAVLTGVPVHFDTHGLPDRCPPLFERRRALDADPVAAARRRNHRRTRLGPAVALTRT